MTQIWSARKRALDVAELGTIVAVWAHPDDEAFLSAGLMAMAAGAGSRVVCVTATRGEHGTSDPAQWPPTRLAAVRERELAASLTALGVDEHHWLGMEDGRCASVSPIAPVAAISPADPRSGCGHRGHVRPGRGDRPQRPPDRVPLDDSGVGRQRRPRPAAPCHLHGRLRLPLPRRARAVRRLRTRLADRDPGGGRRAPPSPRRRAARPQDRRFAGTRQPDHRAHLGHG